MSSTTRNEPEKIFEINDALQNLEKHPIFKNAQRAAASITSLLGLPSNLGSALLSKVPGTIANQLEIAEGYADKRAAYKYNTPEGTPFDIKLFWVQKTSKRIISSLVALTPNFEDEPFYPDKNIGIDIIIPHSTDRLFLILSSSYNIRLVELKGVLTNTQKEIFTKWVQVFDFNNKRQIHTILWDSLDLKSLNESFYKKIAEYFSELKVHLKNTPLFDERSASHFANRLIGRLIFCWFIRKRGLINEIPRYLEISPEEDSDTYYHNRLEKLFFSILNTSIDERTFEDMETPFLNGGLFEPRGGDNIGNSSLAFPKDYFHRFFAFLNQYNFTTDESTSDYQQVAIDPEMLGKIFENLLAEQRDDTGVQARKAKGAFYTPREIVDYMCRQSIREYLKTQLSNEEGIDHIITDLMDTKEHAYDKNVREKIAEYKPKLISALDNVKIIDPACGSGAFPMGMLKLLEQLYERIDVRFEPYKTKMSIIKNNLYGIDIEPMAVEIARLRAWLSIIVDDDINPNLPNKGIEPLPNLDFKFVCANSLIGLDLKPKVEQLSISGDMSGDDTLIGKLMYLRDEWFDPKDRNKDQIKKEFEEVQKNLFTSVIRDWNGTASRDDKLNLVDWNPFSDKPARFFDPFWTFGIKEGFDIVIGNPPYIGEKGNKQIFKLLKKTSLGKRYYQGKMDIFYFFFHLGLDIVKDHGTVLFITTNYFPTASGACKLRKDFYNRATILNLANFNKLKIFKSALGQKNIITILRKSKENEMAKCFYTYETGVATGQKILQILNGENDKTHYFEHSQSGLYYGPNLYIKSEESDLTQVNFDGKNLDNLGKYYFISQGVVEAPDRISKKIAEKFPEFNNSDGVFVVSIDELNSMKLTTEERKVIKKYLNVSDLHRFNINFNDQYLIFSDKKTRTLISSGKYPNLKKHFDKFLPVITSSNGPYGLHRDRSSKTNIFEKPKVICKGMFSKPEFSYDDENYYVGFSFSVIWQKNENYSLYYLLGLLNSKLGEKWFNQNGKKRGVGVDIGVGVFRIFPIPVLSTQNKLIAERIESLVSQILDIKKNNSTANVETLENQINQFVYKLYMLSDDEVSIVENAN